MDPIEKSLDPSDYESGARYQPEPDTKCRECGTRYYESETTVLAGQTLCWLHAAHLGLDILASLTAPRSDRDNAVWVVGKYMADAKTESVRHG